MDTQDNNNLERALGRVEGKMDLMVTSVNNLAASFESLEKGRLSNLEIKFANLQGRITIIAGVISLAVSIAFFMVQHYWK